MSVGLNKFPNPLNSERHNQEFWICYNKDNHYSLWESNIDCYERHLHRYSKERYSPDQSPIISTVNNTTFLNK